MTKPTRFDRFVWFWENGKTPWEGVYENNFCSGYKRRSYSQLLDLDPDLDLERMGFEYEWASRFVAPRFVCYNYISLLDLDLDLETHSYSTRF